MANLQVRIDDDLKVRAQNVAESMGIDLTQAVRMFLTQMVRVNGLPFRPQADPFYSEKNIRHLEKVAEDLKGGRNTHVHELLED